MLYVMIFAFLLVSSDLVEEATCAKSELSLVIFQPILPQESNFDGKKTHYQGCLLVRLILS